MEKPETKRRAGAEYRFATALAGLMLSVAMLGLSCSKPDPSAGQSRQGRPVPVTVATVAQKDVPLELSTFGKAQSKASVTIKAQVTQVIQAVHFQEGQTLAKGDLLFTLNKRPFEVAVEHARATLARDKVMADDAQLEARRNAELLAKKIIAQEDYDKARSAADALAETLKEDQSAIDAAQIGLDNCTIASPIDGRAGKVLVHAGNLVSANDDSLVTINQIKPIDVFFSLPRRNSTGSAPTRAKPDWRWRPPSPASRPVPKREPSPSSTTASIPATGRSRSARPFPTRTSASGRAGTCSCA
jgi:membrane fusion protein, multidrug efflux system